MASNSVSRERSGYTPPSTRKDALVCVGLLEVTGTWSTFMAWLQVHWVGTYQAPL